MDRRTDLVPFESVGMMGQHWTWMFATGVLFWLLGIAAVFAPIYSTFAVAAVIATLLLIAGGALLLQAIQLRQFHGTALRILQSCIPLVAAALMFAFPEIGILTVAYILSFYFVLSAFMQWSWYSRLADGVPRTWGYASAAISFFLGIFILWTLPTSAFWVPGVLLGIDLVFAGTALIYFSLSARKLFIQLNDSGHRMPSHVKTGLSPAEQSV